MNTTPNPLPSDPRFPTPDSRPLPPTSRDFEIFEQNQVHFLSTRHIADKHGLSQTRVRQIVARVTNWLAAHLPAKSEAEKEAELRLAQHLAAAQLRRQIEQLRNYFDATGDPKYLRHQTRVIAALARLGIIPGALDSLAAEFCEEPSTSRPDSCPLTPDPSVGACSPSPEVPEPTYPSAATALAATADTTDPSDQPALTAEHEREGLQIMERRLLTLLDQASPDDHDRRKSLEKTLASIRRHLAPLELRLSPDQAGVRGVGVSPAEHPLMDQPIGSMSPAKCTQQAPK